MLFVLLAVGLFLLGAVGFTVDVTNCWFHRQSAQSAADAACTAGALDVYMLAQAGSSLDPHFTPGTSFDCSATTPNSSTSSSPAPCWYAATNGYTSPGLTAGAASNDVAVGFPAADSNQSPGVTLAPTALASYPLVRVDVVDRVGVFFMALLSGSSTQDVRAFAVCGLEMLPSAIPIIVLDPTGSSFTLKGSSGITVYGGGDRGIQINSSDASAGSSAGNVNLSQGGPSLTGSGIGVVGGPATNPGASLGTTGQWDAYTSPIVDPFACIAAPGQASGCDGWSSGPAIPGAPVVPADLTGNTTCNTSAKIQGGGCQVAYTIHGCPDSGGCTLYTAGSYPSGISASGVSIFDPGLYYVTGGLSAGANTTLRPGNGGGSTFPGSTFYFADSNSISFGANSGKSSTTVGFSTSNMLCPGATTLPANIPATINPGSVLLGPCTGSYGDPLGTSDPSGEQRGILFFQDRSVSASPALGGGGQTSFVGAEYFHQCHTSGVDTGTDCSASAYQTTLGMGGNSCSTAYSFGTLVVDQISIHGTPCINMDLNPAASFSTVKVGLFR
jgi:Flp pilus assembly protein TadG